MRAVQVPNGRAPSRYAGTNAKFVAKAPGPSFRQWPAVQTTERLVLFSAVPEQTKLLPFSVKNTFPWVEAGYSV